MISLFDYLGRPAGSELGKRVADYAKTKKARCDTREVANKKYKGKVMLYDREFLDEFFNLERHHQEQQRKLNSEEGFPF